LPPSGLPRRLFIGGQRRQTMFGPTRNLRELSAVIAATSADWQCQRCGVSILAAGPKMACPDCAALGMFYMHGRKHNGTVDWTKSFDTIEGSYHAARLIISEIISRHGLDEARRIFANMQPPSDS
jgi:ABC-type ATPase with predicted acetyltransferase domain